MKVTVILQIDDDMNHMFEGEAKDIWKRDILAIVNADVPQLAIKFGDSGNVVLVSLSKVK